MTATATVLRLVPTDGLRLTADGKIVDFLDPSVSRPNTPEERVRQEYARKLHYDYGYSTDVMAFNVAVSIGSETRFADIAIYHDIVAAKTRDQGRIRIVVETKAPDEKSGIGQLKSYVMASAAEGGVWINRTDAPRYFRRLKNGLAEWPNIPHAEEEWDSIG